MATDNLQPVRYAPTEAEERNLLAKLTFVGERQAGFVRDTRNPITTVRAELHRVYPKQMAALDAKIVAKELPPPPKPPSPVELATAAAVRAQAEAIRTRNLSGHGPALDALCGLTPERPRGVVNRGAIQILGEPL